MLWSTPDLPPDPGSYLDAVKQVLDRGAQRLGNFAGYRNFATDGDLDTSEILHVTLSATGRFEAARISRSGVIQAKQPGGAGGRQSAYRPRHEGFGDTRPDPGQAGRALRDVPAAFRLPRPRRPAGRGAPLTPRPVFDYVDGGADEELSLRANVRAFQRYRFQPRTLVNVSQADTSATFLGSVVPLPLALAPTGYTRMMHPAGEIAAARAAQRHGLPYTLSTMATTTIEAVAEGAQPDLWFQLYILRDSGLTKELVDRAASAKYRVLVVTVDCFVTGHRTRDRHNGLVIPPELTLSTLASIAAKPGTGPGCCATRRSTSPTSPGTTR